MVSGSAQTAQAQASEPYISQLITTGANFCPRGWARAEGQLLAISGNDALFSLVGTIYGGDGRTTFALPDLRGRTPIGYGVGPGLQSYSIGQRSGAEQITLTPLAMPTHTHNVGGSLNLRTSTSGPDTNDPNGNALATAPEGQNNYTTAARNRPGMPVVGQVTISNTGGSQPHQNRQPYVGLTWCIALFGIYPSRN
ncbi:phage tail protein [Qipengyuania marisflavi]|uniref:Phage tail protein n=2 Tax=Qipengyuania marisflavi TaxID=2486356 RepID=A0A5S3P0L5_9SPHN|nr:phage tail protein [Qipengyuania marisflavi]